MIMVQKPVHLLSSPSTYHRRHPSAPPVVHVQPTHIPGLLSLSKPHPVTPPRSQQQHQNHNNRQSRLSHNRPKPTNSVTRPSHQTPAVAQPPVSEELNKFSTPGRPTTKSHPLPVTSTVNPDKPPRGRQSSKQSKDKSKQRSNSQSAAGKNNNRRNHAQHHQGSPPNLSTLPSQAEVSNKRNSLPHPHSLQRRQHNSFDPFLVSSESDSDNAPPTPTKANPPPVRPGPKLASRPTGKLARRRQNVRDTPSSPTPAKALAVPRPHGQSPTWYSRPMNLSRSVPSLSTIKSDEVARDEFPVCDDLTDAEDDDDVFAPSTPVRSKGTSVVYDDGPRTAPLTNPRSGFLFDPKPTPTHTPERKREHARFPSEGVFNLSMDEDSSFFAPSNASGELDAKADFPPPRRRIASAASTPLGLKRDFWASSKFQNSPSPDVLPIPAFKAQAALR